MKKLSAITLCFWQFFIENKNEYQELKQYLPEHKEYSLFESCNEYPRYVYLSQESRWKYSLISKHNPNEYMKIARIWDVPELIEHWKLIFKPLTTNNMYYFHSAVAMKITDKNWKESVKEIIPYKVRLAKSEQSLRDTLVRELPPEIDSDDVWIHIAYVFE